MALLDDLQLEVEKIKADELAHNSELEAQEAFYRSHLNPVMRRAHKYFTEIVANLKIVNPDVNALYPLNPLEAKGVRFSQGEYEFDFDSAKNPRKMYLRCCCELRYPTEFHVPTREAVLAHTQLLEQYDFPHHRKDYRDDRHEVRSAIFTLEGPMLVNIRMEAHPADRCIYVHIRNLEDQPRKRYKFTPEQFDDALLDRIARLLVRENPVLVEVSAVSEEVRIELREQVERDRQQAADDLARAYTELEAEKLILENAKLANRAKAVAASGRKKFVEGIQKLKGKIRTRSS